MRRSERSGLVASYQRRDYDDGERRPQAPDQCDFSGTNQSGELRTSADHDVTIQVSNDSTVTNGATILSNNHYEDSAEHRSGSAKPYADTHFGKRIDAARCNTLAFSARTTTPTT